jgi:hypothetical protein
MDSFLPHQPTTKARMPMAAFHLGAAGSHQRLPQGLRVLPAGRTWPDQRTRARPAYGYAIGSSAITRVLDAAAFFLLGLVCLDAGQGAHIAVPRAGHVASLHADVGHHMDHARELDMRT